MKTARTAFLLVATALTVLFQSCEKDKEKSSFPVKITIYNKSGHDVSLKYLDTTITVGQWNQAVIPIESWAWRGNYPDYEFVSDTVMLLFDDGKSVTHHRIDESGTTLFVPSAHNIMKYEDYISYFWFNYGEDWYSFEYEITDYEYLLAE